MRGTLRNLFLLGTVIATTSLYGQNSRVPFQELDGALSYNMVHSPQVSGGGFWQRGAGIDLWADSWHGLGPAASLAGTHTGDIGGNGASLTMVTYLFGPRYTWAVPTGRLPFLKKSSRKMNLFGEVLIGGAHGSDGVFYSSQGATASANSFASQVGGGVDVRLSEHVAVRPIQLDWLRTRFPNGSTDVQDNLRVSFGIVYSLKRSKSSPQP